MDDTGIIYIAGPYSHSNQNVMHARFLEHERYTNKVLYNLLQTPYSPIVHFHEMAQKYKLPTDALWWYAHNKRMLHVSQEVHVLMLPGWKESKGTSQEIKWASALGIEVRYVEAEWNL